MKGREWVPVTMPWESEVKVRKLGGNIGVYNVSRYSRYKEEWLARGRDSKGNSLNLGLFRTRAEAEKVFNQYIIGEKVCIN